MKKELFTAKLAEKTKHKEVEVSLFLETFVLGFASKLQTTKKASFDPFGVFEIIKRVEYVDERADGSKVLCPPRLDVEFSSSAILGVLKLSEVKENQPIYDIFAQRYEWDEETTALFIAQIKSVIKSQLLKDRISHIPGFGTFEGELGGDITFSPDKPFAKLINKPFSHFRPVELSVSETELKTAVLSSDKPVDSESEASSKEVETPAAETAVEEGKGEDAEAPEAEPVDSESEATSKEVEAPAAETAAEEGKGEEAETHEAEPVESEVEASSKEVETPAVETAAEEDKAEEAEAPEAEPVESEVEASSKEAETPAVETVAEEGKGEDAETPEEEPVDSEAEASSKEAETTAVETVAEEDKAEEAETLEAEPVDSESEASSKEAEAPAVETAAEDDKVEDAETPEEEPVESEAVAAISKEVQARAAESDTLSNKKEMPLGSSIKDKLGAYDERLENIEKKLKKKDQSLRYYKNLVLFLAVLIVGLLVFWYWTSSLQKSNLETLSTIDVEELESFMDKDEPAEEDAFSSAWVEDSIAEQEVDSLTQLEDSVPELTHAEKLALMEQELAAKEQEEKAVVKDPVISTPATPAQAPAVAQLIQHRLKAGETLRGLSLRYYGTKDKWKWIVEANKDKITNPDVIPEGTLLMIPKLD